MRARTSAAERGETAAGAVGQLAISSLTINHRAPELRPFFGYYGGKWRDAVKNYPAPQHDTIVEPFAGSAGYSVRYASRRVVLCEVDPYVAGVWRYLIGASAAEILLLPDLEDGETANDLPISQEARWLVGFWLARGVSSPRKSPSSWMRSGISPGSFWGARVREVIASQVDEIRHWQIFEGDYRECPVTSAATWFVDPPYAVAGKHYRFGSGKIDFVGLADWCRSRPGQAIVCENNGASWLPFEPLAEVKTTRPGKRSSEAVWTNTPNWKHLDGVKDGIAAGAWKATLERDAAEVELEARRLRSDAVRSQHLAAGCSRNVRVVLGVDPPVSTEEIRVMASLTDVSRLATYDVQRAFARIFYEEAREAQARLFDCGAWLARAKAALVGGR